MPAVRESMPLPAVLAALLLVLATAPSGGRAAGTPPPPKATSASPVEELPQSPDTAAATAALGKARADAEKQYRGGYALAEEATRDLAAGRDGDAKKKFGKALKKFDRATALDPKYYEAWNMTGYCSRQTGDLKRALAAYDRCLEIAPDYEQAHEYLGEAYLRMGDLAKAKEQLAWLESRKSKDADELSAKIAQAEGRAPAAPAAEAPAWGAPESGGQGAAADSAGTR